MNACQPNRRLERPEEVNQSTNNLPQSRGQDMIQTVKQRLIMVGNMRVDVKIAGMVSFFVIWSQEGYRGIIYTVILPFLELSSLERSVFAPVGHSKNSMKARAHCLGALPRCEQPFSNADATLVKAKVVQMLRRLGMVMDGSGEPLTRRSNRRRSGSCCQS